MTKDEYEDWLRDPITKQVIFKVNEEIQTECNRVIRGSGVYNPKNPSQTTSLLGETIGYIKGLSFFTRLNI